MTKTQTPIADAVADFDSHGVYNLGHVTAELRKAGYQGPMPNGMSWEQTHREIIARGLGGALADEDYPGQRLIAGHSIAHAIAIGVGADTTFGDRMLELGSAHRAYVTAIANAERSLATEGLADHGRDDGADHESRAGAQ